MQYSILLSGLPGKMAQGIAKKIQEHPQYTLCPFVLTSSRAPATIRIASGQTKKTVHPDQLHEIEDYLESHPIALAIEFAAGQNYSSNVHWYCQHNIPFICGSTGPQLQKVREFANQYDIPCVIDTNMSPSVQSLIKSLESMIKLQKTPYNGYLLDVTESHQATKKDASGTALDMIKRFEALGAQMNGEIVCIRDPQHQIALGVPPEYLDSHAWHTYTLYSPSKNAILEYKHNTNGRDDYVSGVMQAVDFLLRSRYTKNYNTMQDVLYPH